MAAPMMDHCPLGCQAELTPTSLILAEGALRRCTACGQLISACTRERYAQSMCEFDVPEGTLPSGKAARRHRQRISSILTLGVRCLRQPPESTRMLDVGCSSGSVLAVAKAMGLQVHGVEPASRAANTARNNGFDVFTGYLDEARFDDGAFDLVTLFEVIEHVPEPLDLMREIRRILRPGGVAIIGTGNTDSWTVRLMGARWDYFRMDAHGGHISFFNPRSMRCLAERSGLALRRITAKRVSLVRREDAPPWAWTAAKLACEALAAPARLFGKGHDMLAILEKPR